MKSGGFTLIELLIVVAIIALIATLAAPGLQDAMQKGKRTATMADLSTLGKAIIAYDLEYDTYPISSLANIGALAGLLEPRYIAEVPKQDRWKHEYQYEGSVSSFTIISYGKDGVPSGPIRGKIEAYTDDIRYSNGKFVTKP